MEEPELKKVEKELSGVKRQLAKVEANTRAVDAAIAGQGTYRGYSGEDCFLKDNLRVVQKEMLKQLRRKERGLDRLRRELMARVGVPTAGQDDTRDSGTIGVLKSGEVASLESSADVTIASPRPEPSEDVAATYSKKLGAMASANSSIEGAAASFTTPKTPSASAQPIVIGKSSSKPEMSSKHLDSANLEPPTAVTSTSAGAATPIATPGGASGDSAQPTATGKSSMKANMSRKQPDSTNPVPQAPVMGSKESAATSVTTPGASNASATLLRDKSNSAVALVATAGGASSNSAQPTTTGKSSAKANISKEQPDRTNSGPQAPVIGSREGAVTLVTMSGVSNESAYLVRISSEGAPASVATSGGASSDSAQPNVIGISSVKAKISKTHLDRTNLGSQASVIGSREGAAISVTTPGASSGSATLVRDSSKGALASIATSGRASSDSAQPAATGKSSAKAKISNKQPGSASSGSLISSIGSRECVTTSFTAQGASSGSSGSATSVTGGSEGAATMVTTIGTSSNSAPPAPADTSSSNPVKSSSRSASEDDGVASGDQKTAGNQKAKETALGVSSDSAQPTATIGTPSSKLCKLGKRPSSDEKSVAVSVNPKAKRPALAFRFSDPQQSQTARNDGANGNKYSDVKLTTKGTPRTPLRLGLGYGTGSGSAKKASVKRDFSPSPRIFKTTKRGRPADAPRPASSVEEYLANTQRGMEAVASIKSGTVFWIKFSDTKEAWLECGIVVKVHHKSAKPYEVEWRPYDSSGVELADDPQHRISLLPRLHVSWPSVPSVSPSPTRRTEQQQSAGSMPKAGTVPKTSSLFIITSKKIKLNVPPIGSWTIVESSRPWGDLGPFAF